VAVVDLDTRHQRDIPPKKKMTVAFGRRAQAKERLMEDRWKKNENTQNNTA
jgi:hypothetical protein